jgi:hypothetical protein
MLALGGALAGCGSSGTSNDEGPEAGEDTGTQDSGQDGPVVDAAHDAMVDAASDAMVDAANDAKADAGSDATTDAASDATPDVAHDVTVDAPNDVANDTTVDVANDTTVDAPVDATNDNTLVDATNDGTNDGTVDAPSDGSPAPSATQLVSGSGLSVEGMTTDGHVLYYDSNARAYSAAPLDGGAPTLIYTAPSNLTAGYGGVLGNIAYVWAWNSHYVGTLTTWISGQAQGVTVTSSGLAYLYQTFWASDDSAHVAYIVATNFNGNVGALYGANADGTGATVLLPNIDINSAFQTLPVQCFPRVVFRGDYVVVSSCAVTDASITPSIQSFNVANGWTPAATIPSFVEPLLFNTLDHAPFTFPFAVDPDGGAIAAATSAGADGGIQVFPIDGGPGAVAVDPSVPVTSSLSFTGSVTNPWSVLYNDSVGALRAALASNPSPQVLVDAGVNYFNAFSNDGQWMLASTTANGGWFADLSLVSLQSPGSPVSFATMSQFEGLPVAAGVSKYGGPRGFTADSAYALAETDLVQTSNYLIPWIGYLRSMSVTSPSTPQLLTNGYAIQYTALHGSKVLVSDNLQGDLQAVNGAVDLDVVDPAGGSAVTIASGVAGDNAVSADKMTIAYSANLDAGPGIYVSPLP